MLKNDKLFLIFIFILIAAATYGSILFVDSVIKDNLDKRNSYYELLEINSYPIVGSDRLIKVVRMMKIESDGISVHEIDCYTEAGVNQVLWRLQK